MDPADNLDAGFNADIEKNMSELFHVLLTRVTTQVFSHKDPADYLFPSMVTSASAGHAVGG